MNNYIETRRSIRKYLKKEVTKETIEQCLQAAIYAPSWKNSQTGRYYIVQDVEKLAYLKEECLPVFNRNNALDAPVLIVSTFVENIAGFNRDGEAATECGNGFGYYDLGLQNQNLLLEATRLGLGTLIMGIRDAEKIRNYLQIPGEEKIVVVIAVGYYEDLPNMPKRKSITEISHFF